MISVRSPRNLAESVNKEVLVGSLMDLLHSIDDQIESHFEESEYSKNDSYEIIK